MGGDQLDRGEDWLHGRYAARLVRQAERDQGLRAGSTSAWMAAAIGGL